jgi:hypothetical protein
MKMIIRGVAFLLLAGLLAGCVIRPARPVVVEQRPVYAQPQPPPPPPTAIVIVEREPPPPRIERIPPSPGPDHVWIAGFWFWQNGRHVWMHGHYAKRPNPRAEWEAGRWDHRPNGWIWIEGRWR